MSLESATYIGDLVATNPTSTDPKSQGDDHLRLLKAILQATFPGFAGIVLAAGAETAGATASDYVVTLSPAPAAWTNRMLVLFKATHGNPGAATFRINSLAAAPLVGIDQAATAPGDIEIGAWCLVAYDSAIPSAVLLSGNDRVSRNGDTITGVLAIVGTLALTGTLTVTGTGSFSGVVTGPTAALGSSGTQLATLDFVNATSFTTNLPGQAGNAGKSLGTDGSNAAWEPKFHEPLLALGII